MARKFVPDGDSDFADMARNFSVHISKRPEVYHISKEDADELAAAVKAYRDALAANYTRSMRTMRSVSLKEKARKQAERLVRRAGNFIRANDRISLDDKNIVGIFPRTRRVTKRECPQSAPNLWLRGEKDGTIKHGKMHVIRFSDTQVSTRMKADGAARLELFIDLVPIDEPIPRLPGERHGGLAFYLRSYNSSPITVEYPKTRLPARVVYWGRWANHQGQTGPFSAPLVAPLDSEMWSHLLPSLETEAGEPRVTQKVIITSARRALPDGVETIDTLHAESKRMTGEKTPREIPDAA